MAFDPNNLNAYSFIKDFKERLGNTLQERLESGDLFPTLEENLFEATFRKHEDFSAKLKQHHPETTEHEVGDVTEHRVNGKVVAHWDHERKKGVVHVPKKSLNENVRKDTMDVDWETVGESEKEAVLKLKALAKMCAGDEGAYASGVLLITFKNKQAVEDFATAIEEDDNVDTYEIEAVREDLVHGFVEDQEYDFGDIMFDKDFEFNVYVYLLPELVMLPAEELEVGEDFEWDDDSGFITEVRRKIKVNFRGKKRIKMQCSPGFKWVPSAKTCKKISGAQVAVMRKAMRRAVLTKKSMGQSFKARVVRKARKANRFRKSFGLA